MKTENGTNIGILKTDITALTPEQRAEAGAADFVAMVVLQNPRFRDSLEKSALNAILDSAGSLADLGEQLKGRFGGETLHWTIDEIAQNYGYLESKPMSPTDSAIREAIVGWMGESYHSGLAQTLKTVSSGSLPETVIGVAEKIRIDAQEKLWGKPQIPRATANEHKPKVVFRPSGSGKPRGPGSHTRQTRGKLD